MVASPFARRGYVDSTRYDHASILRFLEWRFLGAPPEGVDASNGRWYLTKRDRAAHNLGSSLVTTADPELDFELDGPIPMPSDGCRVAEGPAVASELGPSDVQPSDRFNDLVTVQFRPATERPWQPA